MNTDAVVLLLKKKQGSGSQSDLAKAIGITPQYLHDVFYKRRSPGPKILAFLKIEKREDYVQVSK